MRVSLLVVVVASAGCPAPPVTPPPPGVIECPAPLAGGGPGPGPAGPSAWSIPDGSFVFLDHATSIESKCVEGECPPGPMISATPPSDLAIEALRLVFGDGFSKSGPAGSGGGGWLFGVAELPYTREDVLINAVAADGAASLRFRGVAIDLAPKQRWECQTVQVDRREGHAIELKTKIFFVNHGVLDKGAITCAQPGRDCRVTVP